MNVSRTVTVVSPHSTSPGSGHPPMNLDPVDDCHEFGYGSHSASPFLQPGPVSPSSCVVDENKGRLLTELHALDHVAEFNKMVDDAALSRFQDIHTQIENPLLSYIRSKRPGKQYRPIAVRLMVLGRSEEVAKPCIVILCPDKQAKVVRKFFKKEIVMDLCRPQDHSLPSFDVYVVVRPPEMKQPEQDCEAAEIADGDSGSRVIDERTLQAYGYVVASDAFGGAYVIPMVEALQDMQACLGLSSIRLAAPDDMTLCKTSEPFPEPSVSPLTTPGRKATMPGASNITPPGLPDKGLDHDIPLSADNRDLYEGLSRRLWCRKPYPLRPSNSQDQKSPPAVRPLPTTFRGDEHKDSRGEEVPPLLKSSCPSEERGPSGSPSKNTKPHFSSN
ncbi:hypothetical protein XA68_15030 [Ophiocordyceps unilateralis]|uniref:Uncharacterized protein n=1 Tax=Ophiocordyceps unilateralis TaxID=268505 RepID=A0A2A9P971_OPHUN|nr:hypothetical protein XA68_15030 [Ophiocordyceps unilateralis]